MKICIIDDIERDLLEIKDFLQKKLKNINIDLLFLEKQSGQDMEKYTHEQQKEKVVVALKEKWEDVDIFLIDIALLGTPIEKPMVSEMAIKEFLEANHECYGQIKSKSKYIIFITNRWLDSITFTLDKEILDNISWICKPDMNEEHPMEKDLCYYKGPCHKKHEKNNECDRNQCLVEIIRTIQNGE